jgi:hypothetical protein
VVPPGAGGVGDRRPPGLLAIRRDGYTPFMPKPKAPGAEMVKTTLLLPASLWKAAKVRAMDERRDLRDVLLDALRAYLKTPIEKEGER